MINFSCRHYKGAKPCIHNKIDASECASCTHGSEYRERILFVKLDAIGDVLRAASLLPTIIERHNAPYIAWMTGEASVELVQMMRHVDEVIELSAAGIARATVGDWDQVYSLSNDLTSASIATLAGSRSAPVGFYMHNGQITPTNEAAMRWLEMGAFDRLKRTNTRSAQRCMLDILGQPEEAAIPAPSLTLKEPLRRASAARIAALFPGERRQRVAINIGSGARWPKKMLYAEQIYQYAQLLQERAEIDVLLVGGSAEKEKAASILEMRRPGERVEAALTEHSVPEFVAVLSEVDMLLCGDTLALHVAPALGLPTVAVFGPNPPNEIHTFDGLIAKARVETLECLVCLGDCEKEANCMSLMDLNGLIELSLLQLHRPRPHFAD